MRRTCVWLLAVWSLLAAHSAWGQDEGSLVLAAKPSAEPALEGVAAGYAMWLSGRLESAGIPVVSGPDPTSGLEALLALAGSHNAGYLLLPSLKLEQGAVQIRLLLYAPGNGELVAASRGDAALATIGRACRSSLQPILSALRVSDPTSAPPPMLDELASSGRALRHAERGELMEAWREVEGKLSPTAVRVREALLETARRSDTALDQRARVLAASGSDRAAWQLIAPEVALQERAQKPDREILLAAAEVQLARNKPAAALPLLERLVARDARDADAQLGLGIAHSLQNRPDEARRALRLAAELDPPNPQPWELLEKLASQPAQAAEAVLQAADREAGRWNLHRAEHLYDRAVELDMGSRGHAWLGRARLNQNVGRHAEALEAWDMALAAGAEDADTWTGLGSTQRALGRPEAEASLRKALELSPGHPDALAELGRMEVDRGRPHQALPLLQAAVEARPANRRARRDLANALRATGSLDDALEMLEGEGAPDVRSPETLVEIAAVQRDMGNVEAARESLERAVTLSPGDERAQSELAEVYETLGDSARAAGARRLAAVLGHGSLATGGASVVAAGAPNLDALALSFASRLARPHERRVTHLGIREPFDWRTLAERWLHPREPDFRGIEASLEQALGHRFHYVTLTEPDSPLYDDRLDRLYAFDDRSSLDARAIADVNTLLGTDAVFATRLVRHPIDPQNLEGVAQACQDPGRIELEMRMLAGQSVEVASILFDVECMAGGVSSHGVWNRRAAAVYAVFALLLVFPLIRGWGTLVVQIKLPPKTRGFLHIKIATKPQEAGQKDATKKKGKMSRSLSSFSRYQKLMAGRETIFRWIPARRRSYYVTVRGPLFDALGEDEIGYFLEEQRVRLSRGETARLTYDFNPSEVAVQVTVLWNGEPAPAARAALRDDPQSLRYARDGTAYFHCGKGTYVVCVGAADRATERTFEVTKLDNALPLSVDLGRDPNLMVRDCPEAVEPYLLGDFATAANALDAVGAEQAARLMRGAHFQQRGDFERAAEQFEAAGCIEEAAELRASGSNHDASAALFEKAGDYARAAEAHREAGDLEAAGRCYEATYDFDSAIACYEEVGNADKALELYEKTGAYLDAAKIAMRHGSLERALQNLQYIERRDPSYGEACRLTAQVLSQRGDFDLAAEKAGQAVELAGGQDAPLELHQLHAELLENSSDKRKALEAYENIRRRDPSREDVTQHIASLRQELSRLETRAAGGTRATPATAPATAPPTQAESRYEILGELGRGGMGVVFKARDKRLGRVVALKQLPDNLRDNPAAARLFLREARAAAALNHVNIVTVYDAGEENGVYHITMELLEGTPLNAIQESRGAIGVRDVARLGIQTCAGLQYAHEQRIVHRDIKTANLFFSRDKVVKIMDFGLAKTIEEVRKNSTVIGGTPYYMAPEQAAGEAVDHRTDLYALGVTFYRLATGTFPFVEGDLAYQHRHKPPPDPREHQAGLDPVFAGLLLELLAKQPDDRPASAADVGARLRAIYEAAKA